MTRHITLAALALSAVSAFADTTVHDLSTGNFFQNWTNTSALNTNDNWSGVASIMGYRGDDLTTLTGTDPQTLLQEDTAPVVDVNVNQTAPNTFSTGGVTEFELANPTIALTGSGTADAPYLQLFMNATGRENVTLSFNVIDLEDGGDNAIQQLAVHYRIGGSGTWTNIAGGYVADATEGPNKGGLVTPVSVTLGAFDNVANLQFRIMTTNAVGNDEWIGIDDISVTSSPVPEPATMLALGTGIAAFMARRKKA
ncbi:MAG: PEP-CTERM sorting domain-containing protein [Fimbriimonadaceae bacterium]|nr:PEP-CTERM sorting domain-containing protein [Fimbriimonadaceae bacterium]QYK55805.1 MAG: PEP-CTERM sorting domain-containing protein [Fimbriimonadaceae bacterium]